MNKNEGLYRKLAAQIWEEVFPVEHVHGDTGRECFLNMVSVGLATGIHAYSIAMAANQAGNIDDVYITFEEPRLV